MIRGLEQQLAAKPKQPLLITRGRPAALRYERAVNVSPSQGVEDVDGFVYLQSRSQTAVCVQRLHDTASGLNVALLPDIPDLAQVIVGGTCSAQDLRNQP